MEEGRREREMLLGSERHEFPDSILRVGNQLCISSNYDTVNIPWSLLNQSVSDVLRWNTSELWRNGSNRIARQLSVRWSRQVPGQLNRSLRGR